jgi:hypothetical protein
MNVKRVKTNIVLATFMLVSLFAVVSSATCVSRTTMKNTGPAISTTYSNGQTSVFAVDSNGVLWNTTTGSGAWSSLGGACTSSPAAISWGTTTRQDVFVRSTDGAVWWKTYTNGWSKWIGIGGQVAPGTGPAVSSPAAGRLDVFVQGTDGALWHKLYNGTSWSGWESLGGKLTSSPAAVAGRHTMDVFVRGGDGAVWYKYYSNGWSSWQSLGGVVAPGTGPAVSGNLNSAVTYLGIHRLFVEGTDHNLWLKSASGSGWTSWGRIGMPPEALSTFSPSAEINVTGPTIISVTSTSGNVWYSVHTSINGTFDNWNTWNSVGSPPLTSSWVADIGWRHI